MAILNFPTTGLTEGLEYTGDNGVVYIYDGEKWVGHSPTLAPGTSSLINGSNVVQVDGDGNLVIPDNAIIKYASGAPVVTGSGSGFQLTSSTAVVSLSSTGTLTLPGNIQSPNSIGINVPNFPTLASKTTAIMSNGTVTTVSNFTTPSQSVIVIASGAETSTTTNTVSSIVSIVGLGLMWTRRAQYLDPASSNNQQAEVWYAINSSGNPITDNIVITFDNPVDDQGTVVSSYVGCNLDTPWTASGPFYSNSTDPSTNSATITMSIAEPHSAGIVFFGVPWYWENADGSFGTGFAVNWSNVAEANNGGAVLWEYDELSYRQFTLPQTDLVVTSKYSGTGTQYSLGLTVIADALVGNGGTSNWTINNGLAFPDGTLQTTAWNGSIPTRWDAVPVEAGCPIYTELTSDHFFAYTQNSHLALENAGDWNLGSNSNGTYIFAVGNTTTIYSNIGDVVISLNNSQSNFIFGLDGNLTIPAGGVISDSTDYLTTRNLHIQGALQGIDGSTGSTGQVLTRQSNGGVAWADSTGGSGVVFEAVNFPTGTSGDTKGTLAYNTLTNQMYLATDTYVQATTTTSTYTLTASQTVLNSQDIHGNMNFSFAVSDNPGLAQILYNISVANGSVQLSSPVLTGVRTTGPGVMNYDLDGINFSIQVPFQSGDPTEIDSGTAFTVTVTGTPSQPNIWHQLPTFDNNNNLNIPADIIVGGGNNGGQEQHLVIDSSNYWTSIQWKNFTSPQDPNSLPFECQAQLLRVFADNNTATQYCNISNPREELVAVTAVRPNGTNYNGLMLSTSDGKIPDHPYNDGVGTRYDWIFGGDGSITFPDNTVQTTAYVTGNQFIWAATDNDHGSITQAVAYDSQGNSYSLMATLANGGVWPATIVKRSSTGSELWKIDLGTDHSVNPWSLVCDGDDNLYVIVQRLNGSVYNNVVLKLNGINGSILWQVDIQDSQDANNMQAVPFSNIGIVPSSGVIVAGTAYNGNDKDFFITALGADGSVVTTLTYGDQWDQQAYSVAINSATFDVVLVGCKKSNTDNAYYLEIIKFVANGPVAWQKSITVDGNYDVQGTDVCLLPDGNWAVLATHNLANGNYGVITMKINNTDGSVMWSREISQGCTNISSSIATDSAGNIYMSAMTYSGNNTPSGNVPITNRLIGAYDTNGNALWQKYFRTFDTSEVLVDPNWWNYIGSTGKQLAVYNDRLLVGTSVVTLGQSGPTGASAVVVQLTTQGENETIGAYETRNSYLTDSAVSLTVADTVFDYTTSTQTLSTGTSVSTTSSTLTFSLEHTGAYVSQLKNGGKTVALETNGTLLDGNGRNVTGEFDGVTDSGNNFSNQPIGIKNASGYKRLVGLTNSAQTWFDINTVATQLGVNPAWIMGVTIEYNVVSSNLNNNGSMTGQIIIASSNNSAWAISVTHSEAVLTTSNSSNDVVFANLNLWQPSGWTLQAVRTDSNSQQLDIIWTAKVFINASESYC